MFSLFFEKALKATVMSTALLIKARASKALLLEAYELAGELEEKFSAYKKESLLTRINQEAGHQPVACDAETIALAKQALEIARATGGRFDPTVGVLSQGAYGFGTGHARIPSGRELAAMGELVDYRALRIDDGTLFLEKKGMRLDLGGIGKGYAAAKLIRFFQQKGVSAAMVSVGGEICCYGRAYTVGIRHPFGQGNLAVITTGKEPTTIATSGDYERYIGSREHHHILDTATGKASRRYAGMTLIKQGVCGAELDALATAFFNTPEEELIPSVKAHEAALLAVGPDQKIILANPEASSAAIAFTPR